MKELTVEKVKDDFKTAYQQKKRLLDAQQEDTEFALGKQWDDADVAALKSVGVRALTINKINPIIALLTGIESQNRTDFKAYPEGKEDSLISEIVTILLKNVMKNAMGEYKVSEQFKDGITCGESYILPHLDYSKDFLFAELCLKKKHYYEIFPDPYSVEYDLSDAKYICTVVYDLSKDDLLSFFHNKKSEIDELEGDGRISIDESGRIDTERNGYKENTFLDKDDDSEPKYDLLAYDYKYPVKKYFILDGRAGEMKETSSQEEAENYLAAVTQQDPKGAQQVVILEKTVQEVWCAYIIGNSNQFIQNARAWSYPKWKSYPIIPYYCDRATTRVKDSNSELKIQGIVRKIKDLNREYNKRRTQELRILNSSANSGWLSEEGVWVDEDTVAKFGSSPGVILKYKPGMTKPEKIVPTPLSQGHAQLAAENAQDIKDVPGINPDLLAMQEGGTDSGRAIALRQKQGLVMVQKMFDNLSQTKRILGKFILTQLPEIYSVERVIKVLGDAFIQENFSVPVMMQVQDPNTGQMVQIPQIDPMTGQTVMQVDQRALEETINGILNDPDLENFDVAVGEGANSETVRFANYELLKDMLKEGLPIPPDIIIDESNISPANKERIKSAFAMAQQANSKAESDKKGAKKNG